MQVEHFLERSAARFPDKVALVCAGRRVTYRELDDAANRLAHGLREAGARPGDRIAILLENSVETVISVFGILKAGGIFVVLNPTIKAEKLAFVLNNSGAVTLITHARREDLLFDIQDRTPQVRTVVLAGYPEVRAQHDGKQLLSFESLVRDTGTHSKPANARIDMDTAALIYTSGSTGIPKGVTLTHLNITSAARSITTYLENTPDDIVINVLPMSFDYGLYQVLMAFKFGGTIVLERSFTYPHAVLETIVAERVTGVPIVPSISAILLQMDLRKYDLSRVRYITNTAAALPAEHIRKLRALLPHAKIYKMYGLTECKRATYLPPEEVDARPTSVGKAMPNVDAYVVDEQGRKLSSGVGELVVRGSNVMNGYWGSAAETDAVLRPGRISGEKVLYTGDVFRMDDEGFLYFLGRKDDIIKSRGEKVSPREVENVLYELPDIVEAAVVGIPDPVLGQAIKAYVAPRDGSRLTEREVLSHCAERLEDFMVPQIIELRPSLPKNGSGKIDKRALESVGTGAVAVPTA